MADDGPIGRSLAAILLALAWVLTWRPQVDPDVWWHLGIGGEVLASGDVPRADTVSWLTAGDPFVAHSWLWDVAVRLAYDIGGLTATSVVALPVSAAIVTILWGLARDAAPAVPPLGAAVAVAAGIVAGLPIWTPRAQLWDLLFILACTWLWRRYLRTGHAAPLAIIPLITIAWANLHGSGVLAFPTCLVALAVAIPVGMRWSVWSRPRLRPLVISSVVALATLAINPYGPTIPLYPFDPAVASAFHPAIDEWRSPDFDEVGLLVMRVLVAGALLVAVALRDRGRDPFLLLLAAGWTFVALGSVRFILVAGPLLILALLPAVADAVRTWAGGSWVSTPAERTPRGGRAIAWVGASFVILVLGVAGAIQISPARQSAEVAARYPVGAVDRLVEAGCTDRILNAYDWGGYVAFRTGQPVGAYGNSPGDVVAVEAALERLTVDPAPFLEANRVGIVLMRTGSPLDRWLDLAPGWSLAGRDAIGSLHVRSGVGGCLG